MIHYNVNKPHRMLMLKVIDVTKLRSNSEGCQGKREGIRGRRDGGEGRDEGEKGNEEGENGAGRGRGKNKTPCLPLNSGMTRS